MSSVANGSLSATHFRSLLEDETKKLDALCLEWEALMKEKEAEDLSEENSGQIRSAIGLAHLLVNQRFKQFSGLIKNCEEGTTPKVTPSDLQGFWEMVYYQVEDIHKKFHDLSPLKKELLLGSGKSASTISQTV